MTAVVSPFLLVSWMDLAHTMLDKNAMVEILAKLPVVAHRLLLHLEITQPVYLFVVYWKTGKSTGTVWMNQTSLEQMRELMTNLTQNTPRRRLLSEPSVISTAVT